MRRLCYVVICLLFALWGARETFASEGDRSQIYKKCVSQCCKQNCTEGSGTITSSDVQPYYLQLWSCEDDCKYTCMWYTVDAFVTYGWGVPQFHGRWPFVRMLGLQEPASVLFSLFNLVANLAMLQKFRVSVPSSAPTYKLWHYHSAVCINAWMWSSIFHTRDSTFTELMDYFCAFSMVLFSFYAMIMRLLRCRINWFTVTFSIMCGLVMVYHVTYLSLIKFDYGYNMKANILIGVVNGLSWLWWCGWRWRRDKQRYVWRCALAVVLAMMAMSLEVLDFPPLMWTLDAHSLWHLSTVLLPLLWYRFLIDDCLILEKERKLHHKKLL